jgi:hypothetical protein
MWPCLWTNFKVENPFEKEGAKENKKNYPTEEEMVGVKNGMLEQKHEN